MAISALGIRALTITLVAAILAGCGAQNVGTMPQVPAQARKMSGSNGDLLYTISGYAIDIFSYPEGTPVTSFYPPVLPYALCTDQSGDVFVPGLDGPNGAYVLKYAHGATTPEATIEDGTARDMNYPSSCSVDPNTGNLAVVNYALGDYDTYNIAVFPNGETPATFYSDSTLSTYSYCAYDDNGDLFVDGSPATSGDYELTELANGATAFADVSVGYIRPGTLQWVSGKLALAEGPPLQHHYNDSLVLLSISQFSGKVVKRINYRGSLTASVWIQGNTMLGPSRKSLAFWGYPRGGRPTKLIKGEVRSVVVSVAPTR